MSWEEFKGLKYYIAYAAVILGFFVYSGMVGWKWFNPTSTTHERSGGGTHHTGRGYVHHK